MNDLTQFLRMTNTALLLTITIILFLILRSFPQPGPTKADIDAATKAQDWRLATELRGRMPKMAVEGAVEVLSNMDDPIFIQN